MAPSSSRSRLGPIIAIVVVLVLLIGGALYARRVLGKDRIAMIGDSITDVTASVFHEKLDGEHQLEVRAIGGKEVAEMMPAADELAPTAPDQVVINLGTNDVIHGKDMTAAATSLGAMTAKFAGNRCIHLVTINEGFFSTEGKDLTTPARQLNQAIRQLAQANGYRIVDWADIAAKYAAAGEPNGHLTSDTIHPEAAGRQLLADAVRESVDACKRLPL